MAQASTRPTSRSTCRSAPPRQTPRTSRPRPSCDHAAASTGERRATERARRTGHSAWAMVHGLSPSEIAVANADADTRVAAAIGADVKRPHGTLE
eukprot:scaffold45267_cov61-Phaeocystis_antarctica.AAC.2